MTSISVQRYDLFIRASRLLQRYRQMTPELRPVGIEVALAMQHYRTHPQDYALDGEELPWAGSSHGMPIDQVARQICDPFYTKSHLLLPMLPPSGPGLAADTGRWSGDLVWPLFNQGENGLVRPLAPSRVGGKLIERRWIKGCNSQEGLGCHALAAHLWRDEAFLSEDRDLCPFRLYDGRYPLSVDQGRQTCSFDDHPCGWKPGHPKMLQILGRGHQAEVLQASWTEQMWGMLIPAHRPLPVYPVLVMLYFGHPQLQKGREQIKPDHLRLDLNFSLAQFRSLFDLNPDSSLNRQLLATAEQPPPELSGSLPADWQLPPLLHQPSGGKVVLDPDEVPQFRSSGIPGGGGSDPLMAERRRRRQLERSQRHNQLVHHFRRWFRLAGLEVREDQHTFDFLAVAHPTALLAEIKLLYQQDISESIQEVIGQLLFYERFALTPWLEQGYHIQKAAVFDRPPPGEYLDFLQDLGIASYWLTEDPETPMIDGPEDSLRLLRQMEIQVCPDPEFAD